MSRLSVLAVGAAAVMVLTLVAVWPAGQVLQIAASGSISAALALGLGSAIPGSLAWASVRRQFLG